MNSIKIRIAGDTPLLMHNSRLANPLDAHAQRLSELHTAKKRKGADKLALLREIADVEWEGGLYHDDKDGPVIPTMMLKANIVEGAKLTRGGANVARCVTVLGKHVPLQYDGPRDIPTLRADANYRDLRMVQVSTSKVLRCRPKFEDWSAEFTLVYDPDGMDPNDLLRYVHDAGMFQGIGDHRGKGGFGRYSITHVNGKKWEDGQKLAA